VKKLLTFIFVGAFAMISVQGSTNVSAVAPSATVAVSDKVTICHRTSSVTNPYVQITIAQSSIGSSANKHGGSKHDDWPNSPSASKPVPNVFNPATTYTSSQKKWGDIIPLVDVSGNPLTGTAAGAAGLNYIGMGESIYNGTGIYAGLCGNFNQTAFCNAESEAGITGADLQADIDALEIPEFTSCALSMTTTTIAGATTTTIAGTTATTIAGTTATTVTPKRKLKGKLWVDANRDGKKDVTELVLMNYTVTLSAGPGNSSIQTYTVKTDADGNYEVADLPAGEWIVRPASLPSKDYDMVYDSDSNMTTVDWAVVASVPTSGEATADFAAALSVTAVLSGLKDTLGAVAVTTASVPAIASAAKAATITPTATSTKDLPKTGSNSAALLLVAAAMVLMGWFLVRQSHS
jgi:LPXTG-motif cell wall-anchored protein